MTLYANRYLEIKELGSGVTGRVYLVKDEKTGLTCALKMLHSPLGYIKYSELEGFQHEFEILKNLNHPSIAKVFDFGVTEESRHLYIVTEFIEGCDLFDFSENKSIDVIEELFVQTLRALNYLHSKKVVHLDIKPQNILVSEKDGALSLKLLDFGFANFYQRKFIRGSEGGLLTAGTTPYLSPEVIKLENAPDNRADLYSLGCTFYKILTREVPFKSQDVSEIYYKHLNEEPAAPSTINKLIPEYFDKIILKLMAKDPANRYQDAQEVIKDLNMLSGKEYPVETLETRISYIPQKGKLIGRDAEFKKFEQVYGERIGLKEFKNKPYLIIKGKTGSGKTRFIEECKNRAQAEFTKILSWKEFKDYKMTEDVPTPSLVLADGIFFNSSDIEYVEVFFEDVPILVLFATNKEETTDNKEQIIELKDFTIEQTKEYLSITIGLSEIPDSILEIIYAHTQGNPLYLTEYVRVLLEKGFFKDSHGGWSLEILKDLGSEIVDMGAAEFVKNRLKQNLKNIKLTDIDFRLLFTLALIGKPTLEDLSEMTGAYEIETVLQGLVEKNILETDPSNNYSFVNLLYKDVLLEMVPLGVKHEICDAAADCWEHANEPKEKILYYRGRGGRPEAAACLLELARINRSQNFLRRAKENLLELVGLNQNETQLQAYLELGEILIETGEYEEAEKYLKEIPASTVKSDLLLYTKTLEQLGIAYKRMGKVEQSTASYEEGLTLLKNKPEFIWMTVVFNNLLAKNLADAGEVQKAETLFCDTWEVWKNQLSEEEKILAIRSNIDSFYYLKGEFEKAITFLEELLTVVSKQPHLEVYPVILYKLGRTCLRLGQNERGKKLLYECLDLIKNRQMSHQLYTLYNELGNFHHQAGELELALDHYQHAFNLAERKSIGIDVFIIAYNIATIHCKMNHWHEAEKFYNFALRNMQHLSDKEKNIAVSYNYFSLLGLAAVYRQKGELKKANENLEAAEKFSKDKPNLQSYAQYFWQEKADLKKAEKNELEAQKALKELEALLSQAGFNKQDYEAWKKSF